MRDGRRVAVRPLEPGAADRFQQFIRDLSPTARTLRFHGAFSEAPPSLLRALTSPDQSRHVAWVAQECGSEGPIVAEARYAATDGEAEFAIAVADAWRRQGLGRALLRGLLRSAAASGVRRVWGFVRRDNEPMLRMARSAGFGLRAAADDASVVIADQRLDAATGSDPLAASGPPAGAPHRGPRPPAPPLVARALRWIRTYGLPVIAALLLPGGILVAVAAGLARLWRLRAGRNGEGVPMRTPGERSELIGEVR